MKTVSQMRIKETIRLDACQPEDNIQIGYSVNSSWKKIGGIILVKIKPLANGKVQIKYKDRYIRNAKVQKADLDGSIMVERQRDATRTDVLNKGGDVTVVTQDAIEILPPL